MDRYCPLGWEECPECGEMVPASEMTTRDGFRLCRVCDEDAEEDDELDEDEEL